jgi:RNA 3'-terminal phosphate cyclase (ATP)
MIEIDGSYGEGGGQVLRTALSLSCLFRKPFRIFNIRKGRGKPGLMPQHLTAVRAAGLISGADVKGDKQGSTELLFLPNAVKHGSFFFDIGTAGSTMLVLQTLLPALLFSEGRSRVTLKGGTHVPFSPSFHYVEGTFLRMLEQLGIRVSLTIESYGFYPKGGGMVKAEVFPSKDIRPLNIEERGQIIRLSGYSGVANLPLSIAERQQKAMMQRISSEVRSVPFEVDLLSVPSIGQGTFTYLHAELEHSLAGFGSLGERGKKAEVVGAEAADEFLRYYQSGMAFDEHLPDQIALYLSLFKERSVFTTSRITQHLMTNLWCISQFHDFKYAIEGGVGEKGRIKIN